MRLAGVGDDMIRESGLRVDKFLLGVARSLAQNLPGRLPTPGLPHAQASFSGMANDGVPEDTLFDIFHVCGYPVELGGDLAGPNRTGQKRRWLKVVALLRTFPFLDRTFRRWVLFLVLFLSLARAFPASLF